VTPQLPPSQDREEGEIKVAPSVPFFQWAIIAITSILFADSENFTRRNKNTIALFNLLAAGMW
jgi:hypothetical protein